MDEDTISTPEEEGEQVTIQARRRIITSAPPDARENGSAGRRRYAPRRKIDPFRADRLDPDYKDIRRLSRCISEQGKILPRRRLGTDAETQRKLAVAIKRARHMALLPFVATPTRG